MPDEITLTIAEARALKAEAEHVTASVIAPLGFGAKISLLTTMQALSFSAHGAHPGTAEFDQRLAEYIRLFTLKVTAMSKAEIAKESLPPFEALAAVVEALGCSTADARAWLVGCGVEFPSVLN